jgi:MoxR-like ATPase
MTSTNSHWGIFRASGPPHDGLMGLPPAPPWRSPSQLRSPQKPAADPSFELEAEEARGKPILIKEQVRLAINAALFLRRPLLLTGRPGVGKSSIISAVAYELRMGPVLRWPITSRSTVTRGLYEYDAIGRLHDLQAKQRDDIGSFVRLGPLGTALYSRSWPRALLIDELDKGDLDLPNDLLNVLEEGTFEIPELVRAEATTVEVRIHGSDHKVPVTNGKVQCGQFPFLVMTSNGEREFPAPFLRRCIRMTIEPPSTDELTNIVRRHLNEYLRDDERTELDALIADFHGRRESPQELATDQLLNAAFLLLGDGDRLNDQNERENLVKLLFKQLTTIEAT